MHIIGDPIESDAVIIIIGEHETNGRRFASVQERSHALSLKIKVVRSMMPGKNVN